MTAALAVRAETGVTASFARSFDLSDRERHLLVRRLCHSERVQDREGLRPPGLPVSAEQEGGLQHSGFPMGRRDSEDVLDRRESLVKGPGDLSVVLELFFVLDFSLTQRRLARFSGFLREANRLGEVGDGIELPGFRVVRSLGVRDFDQAKRFLERAAFQGSLCLVKLRR